MLQIVKTMRNVFGHRLRYGVMGFGTPLRYPGGKGRLSSYISKVISANGLIDGTYIEPYAGGAGMAINLLLDNVVSDIVLNDADRSVFAFWKCVTERTDELIDLIRSTEVTVDEWGVQREVQSRKESTDILELGFSTFFLNRTNRSGILTGGIIGGKNQSGKYHIDARFNKDDLIARIERIGELADHITVECKDGIAFIKGLDEKFDIDEALVYIDPPYYVKGSMLYLNHYSHEDHVSLSRTIMDLRLRWILSYDDAPEIKDIYKWAIPLEFEMYYSTYKTKRGRELFFTSKNLELPNMDVKPYRGDISHYC